MQKQAPTLGRLLVMVGFALSCFGLLLFLWLAFGGPIPLKPKGYQFKVSFGEATQLAVEADVRISGVPGRQGQDRSSRTRRRARSTATHRARGALRADRRRDTQAILRQKTLLGETYVELTPGNPRTPGRCPRAARCRPAQVSADRRARRDLPRVRPRDARRRSRRGCRQQARARPAAAARTSTTRSATSTPFAERRERAAARSSTRRRARSASVVRNTGEVFDALSERARPAAAR